MTNRYMKVLISALILILANAAFSQEHIDSFHNIAEQQAAASNNAPEGPFGAVQTKKISLINLAPALLTFFNNGPVFGVPGTTTGSLRDRTQLTGDWGGIRTRLAKHGLFFDVYSTTTYQSVMSGGLETGGSYVQNIQYSINLDTARAGLWSGGLFHFTAQSRYGDSPTDTFTAGTAVPQYMGLVHPGPLLGSDTYPTEYFLVQALSKKTSVVIGKISDIFIPDQTLFGSSYKYHFANFNFLKNPMTVNFYNPTALAALGVWVPTKNLALAGGVLDPNSEADNLTKNAFDKVNLYFMSVVSYKPHHLPGQIGPAFNWSNKPKIDLALPFENLQPAQIPQAISALLGVAPTTGLDTNYKKQSWFAIMNGSQYLFVKDDPSAIAKKMKSGQLLSGIGVFGRLGFAADKSNTIARDGSLAVFAHGLLGKRQYDSFGAGFYYNNFSDSFKKDISLLTAGTAKAEDEKGFEAFYDFAVTPAVRLIPSYQHIWNPLTAQVAKGETSADVFLLRLTLAW